MSYLYLLQIVMGTVAMLVIPDRPIEFVNGLAAFVGVLMLARHRRRG